MIYEVYLAGPEVFDPEAKEIGEELKAICAKNGLKGLFPLDAELGLKADPKDIFEANVALIRQAKGVIANMAPFRGPSTDVGTAWEIGFAYGLGKPVVAYSGDRRFYAEKVRICEVEDGLLIENFGLEDNLMLHCSLTHSIEDSFVAAVKTLRSILDRIL
jgi:nucleoside 2-deoxyribosyltransferase